MLLGYVNDICVFLHKTKLQVFLFLFDISGICHGICHGDDKSTIYYVSLKG